MRGLLLFLGGALGGFLIYGIAAESSPVAYYVPITVVLVGVMAWIHRAVRFSMAVLWGLAAVAIGNVAGGVLLVDGAPLYQLHVLGPIQFDKVFHAVATGVGAWAALEAVRSWGVPHTPAAAFLAVMVASGGGGLVELVEYAGSLLLDNDSVGGYANNMQDLAANTAGALAGAVAAYRLEGRAALGAETVIRR